MLTSTIVIFGASGDLTRRKLVPALFNLYCKGRMPARFNIVGTSRRPWSSEAFREKMRIGIDEFVAEPFDAAEWQAFSQNLHYTPGDITAPAGYASLENALTEIEGERAHRLYYLSTAPRFFPTVITGLGERGMLQEDEAWRRVVIEKPFGRNLQSARELNAVVHTQLSERQVYRIDHYLAKETVQNILVFRFGNAIFEPIWNRNYIDHVQITAAESVDVGHRAGYYERSGVLRDMFQNHLLQLLALVSMEAPASFEADALRNEKVKALATVRPITAEDIAARTVRAQYRGYRDASGTAPNTETPTYAALQLYIDNWRWQGVPFYLRSGKALPKKTTEINIQFKTPPHVMFPQAQGIRPNILSLCIQPDEGIHLRFEAKVPDTQAAMRSVDMNFHYDEDFESLAIPEAYERLLLNALNGDAALFTRSDGIERAWSIIDPIIQGWESEAAPPLTFYEPGSWGPAEADEFLARDGRAWLGYCGEHT